LVNSIYDAKKSHCGDICEACKNVFTETTELSQKLLRDVFTYFPETGKIIYKIKTKRKRVGDSLGTLGTHGYIQVNLGGQVILLHRLLFLYQVGILPDQVDHINHNKLDNRWNNLRAVNNTINAKNCSLSKNSITRINGVNQIVSTKKYRAYIMVNRKQIHLGVFETIEDAAKARQHADIKYNFHVNHGT